MPIKQTKKSELVGEGVGFDRIRRITGYLVGTLDRFNDAKTAEVQDRVKHHVGMEAAELDMQAMAELDATEETKHHH